ncbi:hypothetical protein OG342_14970 [Streptomyces bobili]|uniref:hypothetical protein n=1 Tax=Streptomyces bobili TaxID=67280 RepID=UPI00224E2C85|nr:hypothetical protein [Streptomyces bobili]MCX5524157.1 hypothetical protein [Streptomyces bobili]
MSTNFLAGTPMVATVETTCHMCEEARVCNDYLIVGSFDSEEFTTLAVVEMSRAWHDDDNAGYLVSTLESVTGEPLLLGLHPFTGEVKPAVPDCTPCIRDRAQRKMERERAGKIKLDFGPIKCERCQGLFPASGLIQPDEFGYRPGKRLCHPCADEEGKI